MNQQIIESVKQMFPNSNIEDAVSKANALINESNTKDPSSILKKAGVTEDGINQIFNKYGNTMKARAVLGMLGTTPEALKSQSLSILGGVKNNGSNSHIRGRGDITQNKFPKLK